VEARLTEVPRYVQAPRRSSAPADGDQRRTLLRGIAIGIAISIVAIVGVGGNSGERVHRLALVMLVLAVMVAGAWAFSAVRASRRLAELGEHRGR
jgi:peptidoglycan/LPS O-acetylase OafA/YrhL